MSPYRYVYSDECNLLIRSTTSVAKISTKKVRGGQPSFSILCVMAFPLASAPNSRPCAFNELVNVSSVPFVAAAYAYVLIFEPGASTYTPRSPPGVTHTVLSGTETRRRAAMGKGTRSLYHMLPVGHSALKEEGIVAR